MSVLGVIDVQSIIYTQKIVKSYDSFRFMLAYLYELIIYICESLIKLQNINAICNMLQFFLFSDG